LVLKFIVFSWKGIEIIMENQLENQATAAPAKSSANLLDGLSAVGLAGGAIASFVTNNVSAAAIPIAIAVGLHIKNRRDLALEVSQKQETAIAQVIQNINQHQAALTEYLQKFQQDTVAQQAQLRQIQEASQKQLSQNLATQGKELQQLIAGLTQTTQETTQALDSKHKDLEVVVGELRQMESASHIIEVDPKAEAYYQRGQSRQRLGDRAEALIDYTAAINLNGEYAAAYYHRGVVHAELGHRKPSVEDLRQAAKLFFEQGDLDNYHRARDLGKEFYDLQHPFPGEDDQIVSISQATAEAITNNSNGSDDEDQGIKPLVADDGITVGSLFD
jgi:tetratricopeptide (TPR) repeat protein